MSRNLNTLLARLRVALRLARRDLAAHKIRTVVALMLFALPVALAAGFASFTLGYDRDLENSPLNSVGHVVLDTEEPRVIDQDTASSQAHDLTEAIGSLANSLSPGFLQQSTMTNGDRSAEVNVITLDGSKDGTGPSVDPGTVLVNDNAAFLMDVKDGDTVTVDGTALTVQTGADYQGSIVNTEDVPVNQWAMNLTWYFPEDPALAERIAAAISDSEGGYLSMAGWFDPGYSGTGYFDPSTTLTFISIVVLGVVLVSAVITPVFAVAARRQRRAMGLLSATGAAPRDLRLAMLAEGLIVSLIGAAVGLVLSTGVATVLTSLGGRGGFYWSWLAAAPVVLVAVICGVTSALVPAIRAGREDPVQALADGGSERMTGFRWRMVISLFFLVPGLLIVVSADGDTLITGVALSGIGVVLSSSLVVWLLSRLGNALPTAGRLAVRDSLRNNHRTIPAIAAIAGTTFLATAMLTLPYGTQTSSQYRDNVAVMTASEGGAESLYRSEIEQITDRMSVTSHETLAAVQGASVDGSTYDASLRPSVGDSTGHIYRYNEWEALRVTDGGIFATIDGVDDHDLHTATEALSDGKAVVADPGMLDDGELLIDLREYDPYYGYAPDYTGEEPGPADETLSLPAVVVPGLADRGALQGAAISPESADALGLDVSYQGTVFLLESRVSLLEAAGATTGFWPVNSPHVTVDTPSVDGERALMTAIPTALSWLLTLGTVLLVVLLAATESRRDMATITAVGAAPGLLRRFSATQAVFIAAGGTLMGVVVGLLPRVGKTVDAMAHNAFSGFLTPSQWLALGLTAVVGPLLAWLAGTIVGAVTARDRSPVRRY